MNRKTYPKINVNIAVDKDKNQNDIPKNIYADIKIDGEINRDEIIKLYFDTMNSNKDSLRIFFENEREFIYLLNKLKHFITPEQLDKINKSFFEVKNLLYDTANIQNEKMKLINMWYKDNKNDFRFIAYVLFILIVIIINKKPNTYY